MQHQWIFNFGLKYCMWSNFSWHIRFGLNIAKYAFPGSQSFFSSEFVLWVQIKYFFKSGTLGSYEFLKSKLFWFRDTFTKWLNYRYDIILVIYVIFMSYRPIIVSYKSRSILCMKNFENIFDFIMFENFGKFLTKWALYDHHRTKTRSCGLIWSLQKIWFRKILFLNFFNLVFSKFFMRKI